MAKEDLPIEGIAMPKLIHATQSEYMVVRRTWVLSRSFWHMIKIETRFKSRERSGSSCVSTSQRNAMTVIIHMTESVLRAYVLAT
jgi:hypothetical protein